VIELVELENRIDDLVKTYSLGMRQRLGIAQALLGRPKLLILDEPTNGLDPAGIRELREFIRYLAKEQGISVFVSSHILHEVQLMCDRVAIIHQGEVIQTAKVDELISDKTKVEWTLSPLDKGMQILKQFPFLDQPEQLDQARVLVHMPAEKIGEVNKTLLENGVIVTGIRPLNQTLEDIFLQMTGGSSIG
jgi:ABC-2 type transport system ATP-binding protein